MPGTDLNRMDMESWHDKDDPLLREIHRKILKTHTHMHVGTRRRSQGLKGFSEITDDLWKKQELSSIIEKHKTEKTVWKTQPFFQRRRQAK